MLDGVQKIWAQLRNYLIRRMKTKMPVFFAFVIAVLLASPFPLRAEDSIHVLYQEGLAAFQAGQFELAREKLAPVLAANPTHLQTRAMMAQIVAKLGVDNTQLRKSYSKIVIDKIEFADVELDEALQAVRILARKASGDKVTPNIIVKNPELGKKIVTLNLSKVPLSEVLNYLAQLAGAKLVYEKSGVMFTNPNG